MGEIGKVTAVKGDTVEVRIPQSDRCRGCRACQFITDQNQMQLYALNECQAKPGDNVEMDVELITPIAIEVGLRFAIREGGRTVGSGAVIAINE